MARKLTDARVKNLKAIDKDKKYSDACGLYLFVTSKGAKLWKMAYRFDGRQKLLSFGAYPAVSLADARKQQLEAKGLLASGIDPMEAKKQAKKEKEEQAIREAHTFEAVAKEWVETKKDEWSTSNLRKKEMLLKRLSDFIGDKPVADVKPADILPLLKSYDAVNKTAMAHTLAQTASQVFRYARACGYCEFNVADGLTSVLKKIQTKHLACLTDPLEVGRLLRDIDNYKGSISVMYALRILPYVALRSTEIRGAFWKELYFDKAVWTVPATRKERKQDGGGMKMRIAHEIPLSRQALQLFQELKDFRQDSELCFPGNKSTMQCITDAGLLRALRNMGYSKEETCVHGLRATFSTLLNEKKLEWGYDKDIIEKQLAHKERNAIRDAYNHANYREKSRELMQRWADYLDELKEQAGNYKG